MFKKLAVAALFTLALTGCDSVKDETVDNAKNKIGEAAEAVGDVASEAISSGVESAKEAGNTAATAAIEKAKKAVEVTEDAADRLHNAVEKATK